MDLTLPTIYLKVTGHEKDRNTEANYYTNLHFEKTKFAKVDIVSEIKIEIKAVINSKFDKIKLTQHQDASNKEHVLKKQLHSLRQDFLENNKIINHLLSLLQATVLPWLPQNSHNKNSSLSIDSAPVCNNFETPTKNPPQTPKNNKEVPSNILIMNN